MMARFGLGKMASLGIVLLLFGCSGSKTCTVAGKVLCKGKPVHGGIVSFYSPSGEFTSGGIGPNGEFLVLDAPVGTVKIAVTSDKPQPPDNRTKKSEGSGPPLPAEQQFDPDKWFAIDEKYADATTSGKEATLSSGSNTIEINLE